MDATTRNLLLSLTADARIVRTTRNGRPQGADIRAIGDLVTAGLAERTYATERTNRGVLVQTTSLALSVKGARFVASLSASVAA